MSIEFITAILFLIILNMLFLFTRKRATIQKIFFPFYIVMYKTKLGLNLMNFVGTKFRRPVIIIGYIAFVAGVVGVIFVFFSLFHFIFQLILRPELAPEAGVQIALPGLLSIPGLGKLGFWHWIISIFVLAVVHEFSHGIVAIAHKFKIKSSGPALFAALVPIIPAAFVEPDEKKLAKASDIKKYSIFAAGPVANIVLGLICLLLVAVVIAPIGLNASDPIGISFNATGEKSPAFADFKEVTIYNKISGREALDATALLEELDKMQPGDVITFSNDEVTRSITSIQHPDEPTKAYLGIINIRNERKFHSETFASFYVWLKLLFLWLFFLNFFIGLANLLPLGPVDGGLILRTFLERILKKNKKLAINIWAGISLFTLGLIVAAFVLPFILR